MTISSRKGRKWLRYKIILHLTILFASNGSLRSWHKNNWLRLSESVSVFYVNWKKEKTVVGSILHFLSCKPLDCLWIFLEEETKNGGWLTWFQIWPWLSGFKRDGNFCVDAFTWWALPGQDYPSLLLLKAVFYETWRFWGKLPADSGFPSISISFVRK